MATDHEEDEEMVDIKPAKKKEPLSLEELKAKVEAQKAAEAKPRFVSKEERAKEAMRKREEQIAAQRQAIEEAKKKKIQYLEEARGKS